jgi:hypothetical protein
MRIDLGHDRNKANVFVIGTTTKPEALDIEWRKPECLKTVYKSSFTHSLKFYFSDTSEKIYGSTSDE